jgi:hypothetical protein
MTMTLRRLAIACAAAAVAAAAGAETSPYYIGGSVGYSRLSNVLGLPDGASVPTLLGYESKSDNVTSYALVGGIDQPIGRQRLYGDLTLRHNKYARNEILDNNSYAVTAGVDWETVERISGNLTLKANRDLLQFSTIDQPTGVRNLVTTRQADFTGRIGGTTRLTLEAGAGYRSVDYSDASYNPRDFRQASVSLGGRYWPSSGNYVDLSLRHSEGRYPRFRRSSDDFEADRFDRRGVELSAYYQHAGISSLYARLVHSRIDYDLQDNLDFSGFTGMIKGSWQPASKIRLTTELARDRAADLRFSLDPSDPAGPQLEGAQLATALRLRVAYAATAKVSFNANAGHTSRSVTVSNAQISQSGREKTRQFGLGAAWTPTRTSRIACDLSRQRQRSDVVQSLNVSSNSASCSAQLTIQP